jgi:hypothetical protein
MRRLLVLSALGIGLCTLACSSESEPTGPSGPSVAEQCAPILDGCLENQQTCTVGAGGPQCTPCQSGHFATGDGTCTAIAGSSLSHEFPEFTTAAGEEILGLCRSWTLNNDTELWVNAVELEQSESSHHSNWTFVPEDQFAGPDGTWDCDERDYDQLTAALAGGVLYAQSTQAKREVQKFPDGVVLRIPPKARIISDVHVLNTTQSDVTGNMKLTIYTLDAADVTVKLTPFHVDYRGLDMPAHSTSRFWGECDLQQFYPNGFDAQVYYVLPHTHALGTRFFLEVMGGPSDGQSLIDVRGFNGEARGRRYDPPVDLQGATGLRFGCEFDNPRDESVQWGFGDQEMCEALGFAASPMVFESRIKEAIAGPPDGDILTFTGSCETLALPWDP